MTKTDLPEKVRVSVGSAMVLRLIQSRLDAPPTTVYLLTYQEGKCSANCGFCPQAKTSTSRADMLSRVTWPPFPTEHVISHIVTAAEKEEIQRVCIQALNYPAVFNDILALTRNILSHTNVPISVSCQPLNRDKMEILAGSGVDRISIALDAATKELFDRVKGPLTQSPYTWEEQRRALEVAVEVFGKGCVYTHLIVGLGETEKEMVEAIQWCLGLDIYPSLFAFTPVPGTALEGQPQPLITTYRRVQIARYLMVHGKTSSQKIRFDADGCIVEFGVSKEELRKAVSDGSPFLTSGCPSCNRPYYNEKPSGPMYNYPRPLLPSELIEIKKQLEI